MTPLDDVYPAKVEENTTTPLQCIRLDSRVKGLSPFSDDEIAVAALLAYISTAGTRKTISTTDIVDALGIARGSRLWERKYTVVSPRRIANAVKKAGFIRLDTDKARFTLPEGVRV